MSYANATPESIVFDNCLPKTVHGFTQNTIPMVPPWDLSVPRGILHNPRDILRFKILTLAHEKINKPQDQRETNTNTKNPW
jgi:hypothetical protein